jgi:hypothetical protein
VDDPEVNPGDSGRVWFPTGRINDDRNLRCYFDVQPTRLA